MKDKMFRCFFTIILFSVVAVALGLASWRLWQINTESQGDPKAYYQLISYEILPTVMHGTTERRRLLDLNRQKRSEFFLGLTGTDLPYSDYLTLAQKLWQLEGVYWYTGNPQDKNNLTYFVRTESYYLGRTEGLDEFAAKLKPYLTQELKHMAQMGIDVPKTVAADPLLLRWHNGNETGFLNNDGLFEITDAKGLCGAKSCYMLHGALMPGYSGSELRLKIDQLAQEFKAKGGKVNVASGFAIAKNIRQSMWLDAITLLGTGLLISLIVLLIMFKSWRPFGQMLLPFILAMVIGVAAVIGYYGRFHVLTFVIAAPVWTLLLVFYMNFVTTRLAVNDHRPHFTPVGWSLVIATFAYGFLALSARSIFAETALFAVTNLVVFTSYLYGVAANFEYLPLKTHRIFRYMASFKGSKLVRFGAATLFMGLVWFSGDHLFSMMQLTNEVHSKDEASHAIGLDVKTFRSALGHEVDARSYTVSGDTPEMVASKLGAVERFLKKLQSEGEIKSFVSYRGMLVTNEEADKNFAFYESLLPIATKVYQEQGVNLPQDGLKLERPEIYPLAFFTAGGFSRYSRQVLDLSVNPAVSVITVTGITDEGEARLLEKIPGCHSTDMVGELTTVLNDLAIELISVLVIFMVGSSCVIFVVRGLGGLLCLAWPAIIGTGSAIVAVRLLGLQFTIFTVTALVLVYGIGLISAVFLRRVRRLGEDRVMFCATLAFIISLGSYASLLMSKAHGVVDMGIVLLSGLVCATFSALFVDIVLAPKLKASRFARLSTFMRKNKQKSNMN